MTSLVRSNKIKQREFNHGANYQFRRKGRIRLWQQLCDSYFLSYLLGRLDAKVGVLQMIKHTS